MGISFTEEQKKVIELRNRNILVAAAAGSGKTAVLVERIIQMITDPVKKIDVDRLLIVTFTSAAANEMRERINAAIIQKLIQEPNDQHLQKQGSLIYNAQITTISSFCLSILRNNFNEIGLDPGFRVADEGELKLLRQDVLAEILEEQFEQGREPFFECVETYAVTGNERNLEEYIMKIYDFSISHPFPTEWLLLGKNTYTAIDKESLQQSK